MFKLRRYCSMLLAVLSLFTLTSCSPFDFDGDTVAAPGSPTSPPAATKFNHAMVFDCQRSPNWPGLGQFTAFNLVAPYDAELSGAGNLVHIPELTAGDNGYLEGAYIALNIQTNPIDNDTITKAGLFLNKSDNTYIRTISDNGVISFLGTEGLIYISKRNDFGYFLSKSPHNFHDNVTYSFTTDTVTMLNQLNVGWQ